MDKPMTKSVTIQGAWIKTLGELLIVAGAALIGDDTLKQGHLAVALPGLITILVGLAGSAIGGLFHKIGQRAAIGRLLTTQNGGGK